MIEFYKISVRTGDGRDNYEKDGMIKTEDVYEFTDINKVLILSYELFDLANVRKVTIEEYDANKKNIRQIEIFENTRWLK